MKRKIIAVSFVLGLMLLMAGFVVAENNDQSKDKNSFIEKYGSWGEDAPFGEYASYTKYHGNGIYSVVHEVRADDFVKPTKPEKPVHLNKHGKPDKNDESSFYELMGVKWFSIPNYAIADNLPFGVITDSISTWDDATTFNLFGESNNNVGNGFGDSDGINSFTKGDYPVDGVIAVCRTYYYLSNNQIVEFDIMFDEDFVWGNSDVSSDVMDYQNIATHELGHAFGLLDLYKAEMSEQTMFGYSGYNDIKKRTLASGDIAGIQALYGTIA